MESIDLTPIIVQLGMSAIFLFLFLQERRERIELLEHYIEDLRDIAGIRQRMQRVEDTVHRFQSQEKNRPGVHQGDP